MGKKFMLLRGPGVTPDYFMFMLLSEAAIPTVGVPLYAKTPLIGSLPTLDEASKETGWVGSYSPTTW
jgi:hypothetical protein